MAFRIPHFVIALLLLTAGAAGAATIHVNALGTGDHATIQAALNAAATGDVIQLAAGTYTGPGNRRLEFMRRVTVCGIDAATCIIDCQASQSDPHYGFALTEETGGTLQNLTVRNAWWTNGAVAQTGWGDYIFDNCRFENNHASGRGGVWHGSDGTNATFTACVFFGNTAGTGGGCLSAGSGNALSATRCTFVRNGSPLGGSILLENDASGTLRYCLLAWGTQGSALADHYAGGFDTQCTLIYGNAGGDWINGAGSSQMNGNLHVDPLLVDPTAIVPNLNLSLHSPCSDDNSDCGRMGAMPSVSTPFATYGLESDGTGMFATIQDAIDAVVSGSMIRLNTGTYAGDGNRDIDFMGKDLTLKGMYDGTHMLSPVLDAGATPTGPYHRHFDFTNDSPSSPIIANMRLTNGHTDGRGGSVAVAEGAAPIFENVVFGVNSALDSGGAVHISTASQSTFPSFSECRFTYNMSQNHGGALAVNNGTLDMADCTFESNTALHDGGAVHLDDSPLAAGSAADNSFMNNTAGDRGGALFSASDDLRIITGEFTGNRARSFGGALCFMAPDSTAVMRVEGAVFNDNEVETTEFEYAGGGIYASGGTQIYRRLHLSRNLGRDGGGLTIHDAMATSFMDSCVFTEHERGSVHVEESRGLDVLNCEFRDNHSNWQPGGIEISSSTDGRYWITDCLFINNHNGLSGGALNVDSADTLGIRGCVFQDNYSGSWGGAATIYARASVIDCEFVGNRADDESGALDIPNISFISHCRFVENQARDGGALSVGQGNRAIEDCVFWGNRAKEDGTALKGKDGLILRRCTITANEAYDPFFTGCQVLQERPYMDWIEEPVRIENCIISHGRNCAAVHMDGVHPWADPQVILCSTFWHNEMGTGITVPDGMDRDPRFCDWAGGELTLDAASPCLPTGNACGEQIGALGRGDCTYAVPVADGELPAVVELRGNYPNPFNPTTVISYGLPRDQHISLRVYDVHGSLVRTLVDDATNAGHHQTTWHGRNDQGTAVASGVYFYRLLTEDGNRHGKMVLIK